MESSFETASISLREQVVSDTLAIFDNVVEDDNETTAVIGLANQSDVGADGNETLLVEDEGDFFFEFLVPGVLLNIVGLLGLVGNLISIFILSRPQMKGSTNCILIGLASFDSILIITSILMFGLPSVSKYSQNLFSFYTWEVFPYITPFVYPIGLIAQSSSVYLTLCVTIERYVAVCLPFKAKSLCTYGRARLCVIFVGIASLLYNIPRFFEVTWAVTYDEETNTNRTEVTATSVRVDPTYISVYITWMYLVVMYIVPFTLLALLNLRIYIQIRRSTAERAKLTRLQQREIGMATMLICVVIVFFVCNILALVVNILEMMSVAITALTQISNLLVTTNSSVNFIVYIIYGEKFQRLFIFLFCQRCCRGANANNQRMLRRYTTSAATTRGGNTTGLTFTGNGGPGGGGGVTTSASGLADTRSQMNGPHNNNSPTSMTWRSRHRTGSYDDMADVVHSPWKSGGGSPTSVVPLRHLGLTPSGGSKSNNRNGCLDEPPRPSSGSNSTMAVTVTVLSVTGGREASPKSLLGEANSKNGSNGKQQHAMLFPPLDSGSKFRGSGGGSKTSPTTDPFYSGSSSLSISSSSPDLSRSSKKQKHHHHHHHHHHNHNHNGNNSKNVRYKNTSNDHSINVNVNGKIGGEVAEVASGSKKRSTEVNCCKCVDKMRRAANPKRSSASTTSTTATTTTTTTTTQSSSLEVGDESSGAVVNAKANTVVVNSLYDIEYSLESEVEIQPHIHIPTS